MKCMFDFDPAQYARAFEEQGYVHVPTGLTRRFFEQLLVQIEEYVASKPLKEYTVGDKTQALYELPEAEDGNDYHRELVEMVAAVCGLDPREVVMSERHIKSYDQNAAPNPRAHKDRFASQISVGFSIKVNEGSSVVLYPDDLLEVNPFNSSTEMRASFGPDRAPEAALATAHRVDIHDQPRDVIFFRGHSTWHLRSNPAGTVMLYFKFNILDCDPLGEDPLTPIRREFSLGAIEEPDTVIERLVPRIGRRVDYIQRRYNRTWEEVIGVVLWGKTHLTIDEPDLQLLRAIAGHRDLACLIESLGDTSPKWTKRLRRLVSLGVVDLSVPLELSPQFSKPAFELQTA